MQVDCERCLTTNHLFIQDCDYCFQCIACNYIQWLSEDYASAYRILNCKTWLEAENDLITGKVCCSFNEGVL